jgi:hypothetical protein
MRPQVHDEFGSFFIDIESPRTVRIPGTDSFDLLLVQEAMAHYAIPSKASTLQCFQIVLTHRDLPQTRTVTVTVRAS